MTAPTAVQTFRGLTTTIPKGDDDATIRARAERFAARIAELSNLAEHGCRHISTVQIDNAETVTIHDTLSVEKFHH